MFKPKMIYGKLKTEETYVPLEVAESEREQDSIQTEYSNVFGNSIEFWERKLNPVEYRILKRDALNKMLNALRN
jgi:hypothetical protein